MTRSEKLNIIALKKARQQKYQRLAEEPVWLIAFATGICFAVVAITFAISLVAVFESPGFIPVFLSLFCFLTLHALVVVTIISHFKRKNAPYNAAKLLGEIEELEKEVKKEDEERRIEANGKRIESYRSMFDAGLISEEEFAERRKAILLGKEGPMPIKSPKEESPKENQESDCGK